MLKKPEMTTEEQVELLEDFQRQLYQVAELINIDDEVLNKLTNSCILKVMDLKKSPMLKKYSKSQIIEELSKAQSLPGVDPRESFQAINDQDTKEGKS